jgi:hypothetical protein
LPPQNDVQHSSSSISDICWITISFLFAELKRPKPVLLRRTKLESTPDKVENIQSWLMNGSRIVQTIWDEKMMTPMGNDVYRLQVMTVQFVTLQLAPWVDVQMKSSIDPIDGNPIFAVQSLNFDPNIRLLPGMRISAASLGIQIDVAGQMKVSSDGMGVSGKIAFATTGKLPPPLRLLPEPVLQAAARTINQTVENFAIRSFERSAKRQYINFQQERLLRTIQ